MTRATNAPAGSRAAGVTFVLAQIHIDASRELSAEDGIHNLNWEKVRIITRYADPFGRDRNIALSLLNLYSNKVFKKACCG